jgi:hypothetical protein
VNNLQIAPETAIRFFGFETLKRMLGMHFEPLLYFFFG